MRELLKKTILPPPGPVLSIGLIGLMILGGFLYYKAVRFQRFMEPALAMTQPGSDFDRKVRALIYEEFGPESSNVVRYFLGTIFVHESAFVDPDRSTNGPAVYGKLGRIFRGILEDSKLRGNVKVVLVSTIARVSTDPAMRNYNRGVRHGMQDVAEVILNGIFSSEPELEAKYGTYFEPTAILVIEQEVDTGWVAFRIIPSETLHIDVLQRLQKYME